MSRSISKNQIYLVNCRDDVALFCSKVFQNRATIHRYSNFAQLTKIRHGVIIYDALYDSEIKDFVQIARTFFAPVICLLSPSLNFSSHIFLQYVAVKCLYYNGSSTQKQELEFMIETILFAQSTSGKSSSIEMNQIKENEPIKGWFDGTSTQIQEFRNHLKIVAPLDTPVLLLGETGCGKNTAASLIHELSDRKTGPFKKVDIAEVVPSLSASAFFGQVTGAYTDATYNPGYFQQANHGVLFLDEIGVADSTIQKNIMSFIENKKVTPVGCSKSIKLDTRIIAATNADIKKMVANGSFRNDLFYRFNHVLKIPSLRERREDIPYIAKHYLTQKKIKKFLSPGAMEKIVEYNWLGNIRDLHHCLESAVLKCPYEKISADDIDFGILD